MKPRTSRALEHLLAVPPVPEDPLEVFGWAHRVEIERRRLAAALVADGYGERVTTTPTKGRP